VAVAGEDDGYLPIAEHGLVGDLHTVALVGTNGTIDWYCCPAFDAPSVFGSILDKDRGGFYSLHPTGDEWSSRQLYFPDTNVLITRFFTPGGVGEVQDFMPIEAQPDMHRHRLIRRVMVVRGTMEFHIAVQPRFDYGREEHEVEMHPHGVLFRAPSLSLALEGAIARAMGSRGRRGARTRAWRPPSRSTRATRPPSCSSACRPTTSAGRTRSASRRRPSRRPSGTGAAGWTAPATAAAGARWCTAPRSR
jgi:hypothetical protein